MNYVGDFPFGHTLVVIPFPTHKGDGTPITLAGTPAVTIYKDNTTTKSTSGVTLTVDLDSVTGSHVVKVDTSQDATFYASGHDFVAKLSAGTVDGITVVGYIVGSFSIENRSALMATTWGRKLDVAATGEAGLDFTNRLDTTGILPSAQAGAASGLAIVGSSMAVSDKTGFSLSVTPPTAQNIWEYATRALTDKSGFTLSQTFPTNFSSLIISALGKVTVGTNDDKTGYALTTALTAQNVWEYATRALTDKAGFSLSTTTPTAEDIREEMDDHSTKLAAIASVIVPSGSSTYTDIVEDDAGNRIDGVQIEAYSDSSMSGDPVQIQETDINGSFTFHLNPGTYYFRAIKNNFTFTDWTSVVT